MLDTVLAKVFGTSHEREIKRLQPIVAEINGLEPAISALTDEQLRAKTPELKARLGASDVLFVFARAAEGPRMPLAIQRLPATSLPVTVTLDDSTSMMPELKLSTVPRVVIGARVSKSGQATPQPGDFEALSDPVPNRHAEPVRLRIEQVLP